MQAKLEKLSTDIEEGKAPFDQQQALTLEFYETTNKQTWKKKLDEVKRYNGYVNQHYDAMNGKVRIREKMKIIEFVLLLYILWKWWNLIEYTVRDGLK